MEFQMMARESIMPSPLNPRKHFDPEKLQELAGTMANGVGIIEPLVVRSRPDLNCYELVAGERRWRAAALASLDTVPVVVKQLTDAQVLEIMVIENNQREDITPLEEANGFRQLLKLGALDVDALAERLGRSRKYVYDRMKLLDLIPKAQQLLQDGLMTSGHAILLARLRPEQQEKVIDPIDGGLFEGESVMRTMEEEDELERAISDDEADYHDIKPRSVRELETYIARHFRFDVKAPVNEELFPQTAAAVQAARKVVNITHEYQIHPDAKVDDKARVYTERAWKRADGQYDTKTCSRSVLGVVVVGPGYGEAFQVCIHKECDVHWKAERLAREKEAKRRESGGASAQPQRETWAEQQKRDEEREAGARKAWTAATPAIVAACVAKVKALDVEKLARVILGGGHHSSCNMGDFNRAAEHLPAKKDADTVLRTIALAGILSAVGSNYKYAREDFTRRVKTLLGVDVTPLLKAVQTSAKKEVAKSAAKAKAVVKKKKASAVAKPKKAKAA